MFLGRGVVSKNHRQAIHEIVARFGVERLGKLSTVHYDSICNFKLMIYLWKMKLSLKLLGNSILLHCILMGQKAQVIFDYDFLGGGESRKGIAKI